MTNDQPDNSLHVPERTIPVPEYLSEIARYYLIPQPASPPYPAIDDKDGWRKYVKTIDETILPLIQSIHAESAASVEEHDIDGARVYEILDPGVDPEDRGVVLDLHGGGLIMCGGDLCKMMGVGTAARMQKRVWSVDYRMPPDHPYPAALDDCMASYRALLDVRLPSEIIVSGGSAGGNLAAALMLRARDEELPMPAGLVLGTPEADLTESGDSFHTNLGVDPSLRSLMPVNLLYADGHELAHPYLSPLFGDFSGFPPVILTTGTRDLYLSNTVRMHRKLRAAKVEAELHVTEAGAHTGFPGSPEGQEIDEEVRRFVRDKLGSA